MPFAQLTRKRHFGLPDTSGSLHSMVRCIPWFVASIVSGVDYFPTRQELGECRADLEVERRGHREAA